MYIPQLNNNTSNTKNSTRDFEPMLCAVLSATKINHCRNTLELLGISRVPKKYRLLINNRTEFFCLVFNCFFLNMGYPNIDFGIKIVELKSVETRARYTTLKLSI